MRRGWRWAVLLLGLAASGIAASFYYYQGVLHHHNCAYTASFFINGATVQVNGAPSGFAQYSRGLYATALLLSGLGLALGVFLIRGRFSLRGLVLAMLLAGATATVPFAYRPADRGLKGVLNCINLTPGSFPAISYRDSLAARLNPKLVLQDLPASLLKELSLPAEELVTTYSVDRSLFYNTSSQPDKAHVFHFTFHPRLNTRQVATLMEYFVEVTKTGIETTAREQGQPLQALTGTTNLGGDWKRWSAQDRQHAHSSP